MKRSNSNVSGGVLGAIVCLLAVGCIQLVSYEPRGDLLTQMEPAAAKDKLRNLTVGAVQPKITAVDVTDDYLRLKVTTTSMGMFYQTVVNQSDYDIYYSSIDRLELYENNNVYVYVSGVLLQKILFSTQALAQEWIDLLWSFKTAKTAGGA